MKHLYCFTCAPNYPVVSSACVIFHSHHSPNGSWGASLIQAKELARNAGIKYVEQNVCLRYFGELEVAASMKDLPILYVVTGEY